MNCLEILENELNRLHVTYRDTMEEERDTIPMARAKSMLLLQRIAEIHDLLLKKAKEEIERSK